MKIKLTILSFFLLIFSISTAQELSKKEQKKAKKATAPHKGSVYFTPIPVLSVNPAFGLMYGASASTSWFMGDPKTTKLSSMGTGIVLTTKGQTLITNKVTAYSENNKYKLDIDWRYLNSSQATFGLGSGPLSNRLASNGFEYNQGAFSAPINSVQVLKFHWFRLYQTVTKKVADGLYVGLGYHLDILSSFKDNLLNMNVTPPIITSFYAYNLKYGFSNNKNTLSGISLNGIYDTRDNMNAPYQGKFAQLTLRLNPTFLGSDKNSTSLWAEYRNYYDLTKNHKNMLAIWTYANFLTSGSSPYMNLPAVGYDQYSNSARGYTQGKIRGESLLYTELEFRKKIFGNAKNPDQWGVAVFANATTATNRDAGIKLLQFIDPAVGAGIRYMVSPGARTTIRMDYAIGMYHSSGIYLGLNEAF